MVFYYATVFEKFGTYTTKFDISQEMQEKTKNMTSVEATVVFERKVTLKQGAKLVDFVEQANQTCEFDKEKLEVLLN